MMKMLKNSRHATVAATLGVALALGGASYALAAVDSVDGAPGPAAATGGDIASSAVALESSTNGLVVGASFVRWAENPDPALRTPLPKQAPAFSQVNFGSAPVGANSGGMMELAQPGQLHAEASVLLRKAPGGSPAEVTCDLRSSGQPASNELVTTIVDAGSSRVTMPLVGSIGTVAAGANNVGVRCWATGNMVFIEKVDLHAVVYGVQTD